MWGYSTYILRKKVSLSTKRVLRFFLFFFFGLGESFTVLWRTICLTDGCHLRKGVFQNLSSYQNPLKS